jgi:ferredoxin, 2Fe-2S
MEAAVANDVRGIEAQCYGACNCGTCHVFVDPMWREKLGHMSEPERELLASLPFVNEASRLACQITLRDDLDGLVLRLPAFQGWPNRS